MSNDFGAALLGRAIALLRDGQWRDAEVLADLHLMRRPDDADGWHVAGLVRLAADDSAGAAAALIRAVALDPAFAPLHLNLGTALQRLGRADSAGPAFLRALVLSPGLPEAANGLGQLLGERGRPESGRALLVQALAARPDFAEAWHNLGRVLAEMDQFDRAVAAVARACRLAPGLPESYTTWGALLLRRRDFAVAARMLERGVALLPQRPETYSNLGLAYRESGHPAAALAAFVRASTLAPTWVLGLRNRAAALLAAGHGAEAEAMLRRAVALAPEQPAAYGELADQLRLRDDPHHILAMLARGLACAPDAPDMVLAYGSALGDYGREAEAVEVLERAAASRPDHMVAHNNLGLVLGRLGFSAQAVAAFDRAASLEPAVAGIHNNRGILFIRLRRWAEAERSFERALRIDPTRTDAWNNLGLMLVNLRRWQEAVFAYHQTLRLEPWNSLALYCLAGIHREVHQYEPAVEYGRRSIAVNPGDPYPYNSLAIVLMESGLIEQAEIVFRQALKLAAGRSPTFHSNYLFCLAYDCHLSAAAAAADHAAWDRLYAPVRPGPGHDNTRDPARRLKVGYVSPDFRWHSVAFFAEPLMAGHNRDAVEVHAYSLVPLDDSKTTELRGLVDHWRDIAALSDREVVDLIRADGIDILVDLAGHTAYNRMPVFACRPAPVQVTWCGYPTSTGLTAMAARLTDSRADPPGAADALASEALVRLDPVFLCYLPPRVVPAIAPPPSPAAGYVTFGSFSNLAKLSAPTLAAWAAVLRAVPTARLCLKARALSAASVRGRIADSFAEAGIDPARIEFIAYTETGEQHLALYAGIDVALDTFPYNGTTTTCEALWMGVPVVTVAGDRHAARVGFSLLASVGLADLVADSPDHYVRLAVELAADEARRAALRGGLRARLAGSPLCDRAGFVARVEAAYRDLWRGWCEGPPTASLEPPRTVRLGE